MSDVGVQPSSSTRELPQAAPAPQSSQVPAYAPQNHEQIPQTNSQSQGPVFSDPDDKFWALYLNNADKYDDILTDSWKGDADGILIFTGLFAATVATFAVQSYTLLSQDTGAATVSLLSQIAQNQISPAASTASLSVLPEFHPSSSAIRINVLWYTSLFLSLCCALAATLIQQWGRKYLADVRRRGPPRIRGPIHVYLAMGVERFGFAAVVDIIIALLHIAVILFFAGLLELLFSANAIVAYPVLGIAAAALVIYLTLSFLPLRYPDCPYGTPLSSAIRTIDRWFRRGVRIFVIFEYGSAQWQLRQSLQRLLYIFWRLLITLWHSLPLWSLSNVMDLISSFSNIFIGYLAGPYIMRRETLEDYALGPSNVRAEYAAGQILSYADEDRELEVFFDSFIIFLYSPLVVDGQRSQIVSNIWERYNLDAHMGNLISTCRSDSISQDADMLRRGRLKIIGYRSVILSPQSRIERVFNLFLATRELALSVYLPLVNNAWVHLAHDSDPTMSFFGICATYDCGSLYFVQNPELVNRWMETISQPGEVTIDDLIGTPSLNAEYTSKLYNHLRFFRAVIQLVSHSRPSDPVHVYAHIWADYDLTHPEIIRFWKEQANLPKRSTSAYKYFHDYLCLLGLEDILPDPGLRWPDDRERLDCARTIAMYPIIRNTLKLVADIMRERDSGAPSLQGADDMPYQSTSSSNDVMLDPAEAVLSASPTSGRIKDMLDETRTLYSIAQIQLEDLPDSGPMYENPGTQPGASTIDSPELSVHRWIVEREIFVHTTESQEVSAANEVQEDSESDHAHARAKNSSAISQV